MGKIAGRGDAKDYKLFGKFASERLPGIMEEVLDIDRKHMPKDTRSLKYAQPVDWVKYHAEIVKDFYMMFVRSVSYQFSMEPPFNLRAEDATEVMKIVQNLKPAS